MTKLYKSAIRDLIRELEELDKNIPLEKDGFYETTMPINAAIKKISSINYALMRCK